MDKILYNYIHTINNVQSILLAYIKTPMIGKEIKRRCTEMRILDGAAHREGFFERECVMTLTVRSGNDISRMALVQMMKVVWEGTGSLCRLHKGTCA